MASTFTWVNGATANWALAAAWTANSGTPGAADTVLFLNAGVASIAANFAAPETVNFSNSGATLNINNTFSLNVTNDANAALIMSAGTINLTGAREFLNFNNATLSGGQINLSGSTSAISLLNNAGAFTLSGATITAGANKGEISIGTQISAASVVSGRFQITGLTANVSAGSIVENTFTQSGGNLAHSGGTINIAGAAIFSAGTDTFSGTALFQAGTVSLNNTNGITVNGGTVQALSGGGGIAIASGTVITMGGGTLDGTQGGVANAGTITGTGAVLGAITGAGTLLATGGTLEIGSAQSNASPVWQIASASALRFDANASADTVTFKSTADGDLALNGGAITFTDTISGMNVGASATAPTNFIDLLGTAGVTISSGGTVTGGATTDTIVLSTGQTLTLSGVVTNGNSTWYAITKSDGSGGTELFLNSVICYAEGTAILTDRGEVAVESLQAGDRVITLQDGHPVPMAITWTGNRHIDLLGHPRPYTAAPVRIRAGAFGDDLPRRDLLVSPAHGIYVDGKLVPANLLINHMTIVQDMDAASVSYHHIELERHALILAEGLTSESYLDTGNRAYFDNAGLAYVAHPEFHVNAGLKTWEDDACAPLAIDAETVAPIWHSLAARAETLGYSRPALATTADADIFLEANGRRLRPVASADGRYSFMLPAGTKALTLRSRATAPAALNPLSGDWRPLGVAVRGMTLRAGDDHIVIPADHPGLTNGWHTVERNAEDLWRWTAGAATLPLPAIATPMMLDIEIANTATYILAETVAEQRLAA